MYYVVYLARLFVCSIMANFLDKELSEEDIKNRYITPTLEDRGWDREHMRMEYYFTAGRIMVQGKLKHRRQGKKADYLLYTKENYPIAIVEAKDYNHTSSDGLQQAMEYADILDLQFAYSTNGAEFVEHDMVTGVERHIPMNEFPTPLELRERLRAAKNYTEQEEEVVDFPYYTNADSHEPRYYQRIAINKTVEAVARGQNRIMLVMATGTGKTFTAFQIIHRLHASGLKKRILYLADRNILIDQTMVQDFKPFKKFMTKVQGKKPEEGYELYMSLYGQWINYDLKEGDKQPYEAYERDFFDLIVIDECHRSSPREDSQWHEILTYFDSATQIGLTATPKSVEGADNIEYFGEPVFKYSLNDGINDGFLAPYRVTKSFINVDLEGYQPEPDEVDIFNNPIEENIFVRPLIGRRISIKKRQVIVAKRITEMLKTIGRMTKTIVFCPDQDEAAVMRELLVEMNQDMVRKHKNYVVRITSDDRVGKYLLDDFIDPDMPCPVIATTSELLSTGVDCKTCGLIVFDKEVNSPALFKQMIGRGTRIHEASGKMNFEILDFRNATANFDDPKFDGTPTDDEEYKVRRTKKEAEDDRKDKEEETSGKPVSGPRKYYVEGKEIQIVHETVQFLGEDGRTLCTESVTDYTRKAFKRHYPTLDVFRGAWHDADKKKAVLETVEYAKDLLDAVREENPALKDKDEFDVICHIAYDAKPLTRRERVDGVQKRDYLHKFEGDARKVIEGLMDKYADHGILNIEDNKVLEMNPFDRIGKKSRIMKLFNGKEGYRQTLLDLENELYKEA